MYNTQSMPELGMCANAESEIIFKGARVCER